MRVRLPTAGFLVFTAAWVALAPWGIDPMRGPRAAGDAPADSGPPRFVRVRAGDTLGELAHWFGTTAAGLRAANGLTGDLIRPGQRLLLGDVRRPHGRQEGPFRVAAPLRGATRARIVSTFGRQTSQRNARVVQRNTGIELSAMRGEEVLAGTGGIVRFLSELEGLGHVAIVEHADGYRTVYCPLDPDGLQAEVGEAVRRGQVLGRVGAPRWSERVVLRFEVRRGNVPEDPVRYVQW